ncbi:MAG: hypothetical protein ACI9EW_003212 [Cellvibrionaceae bacterium]|jgi:hypothetical protein
MRIGEPRPLERLFVTQSQLLRLCQDREVHGVHRRNLTEPEIEEKLANRAL